MKTLIIAPHIDDELIGCYSVLRDFRDYGKNDQLDVVWLYDITTERLAEGKALAEYFGFNGSALFSTQALDIIKSSSYDQIYVPARQDWHTDHKVTNSQFRAYATHFYSVDMVNGVPLLEREAKEKKALLDDFYPSQSKLWATDASYYLFTSISNTDIQTSIKLRYEMFSVTVDPKYYSAAHAVILQNMAEFTEMNIKAFSKLVGVCPSGEITCEHISGKIFKI
jgi:hypothetical protein